MIMFPSPVDQWDEGTLGLQEIKLIDIREKRSLSDQESKTQQYSIYNDVKERKEENPPVSFQFLLKIILK